MSFLSRLFGGGDNKTVTTGQSEPWDDAQPNLRIGLKRAKDLFIARQKGDPYTGPRVTGFNQNTKRGMQGIMRNAGLNSEGRGMSGQFARIMRQGGFNDLQKNATNRMGKFSRGDTASQRRLDRLGQRATNNPALDGYRQAYRGKMNVGNNRQERVFDQANLRNNPAMGDFRGVAGGRLNVNNNRQNNIADRALNNQSYSERNLRDMASGSQLGSQNPYAEKAIADATRATQEAVNMSASGTGRYGSGVHQSNLAREIGTLQNNQRAQNYENDRAAMFNANSMMDNQRMAGMGMGLNAANAAAGIDRGNAAQQFAGMGAMNSAYQNSIGNRLNAANAASSIDTGNQNRIMSGIAGLGGTYSTGIGQGIGVANSLTGQQQNATNNLFNSGQTGMNNLTTAYQNKNLPYQDMMMVGSMYEDLDTRNIQAKMDKFREIKDSPWDVLAKFNAINSGAGSLGNSTSSTVTAPGQSPWANALGYGMTGLGALGSFF